MARASEEIGAAPETWITGAILCTQDSRRRVLRGHLRIVGGKIDALTSRLPRRRVRGARMIDASGLTILPGFVQAHVHLCQTLFRNQADDLELLDWLSSRIWPMEAAHTESTLHVSALLGIHELLSSGTTCILDMATVRHTEAVLDAVRQSGIRASVGKCLMDHPRTTPACLREPTDRALAEARRLHDDWHGRENGRIRVSFAPRFVVSCTEDLLRRVGRLAEERCAGIHTHASENLKEIQKVKSLVRCGNIEYLDRIGLTSPRLALAHCVWLSPQDPEILKRTGTHVVHCPSSNLKLASGVAPVPALLEKGIPVALGADGAPCNNRLDMFREMRLAALIHKPGSGPRAVRAHQALDMATRNGAEALGWLDEIGSIEIGKKADLIALDLQTLTNLIPPRQVLDPERIASSIVYSSDSSHLRWTRVDGRVLFQNGRVETIPAQKLLAQVCEAQRKIARSIRGNFR